MKRSNHTTYRVGLAVLGLLTLLLAPRASAAPAASGPTFTTLYSFSALGSQNVNKDGASPETALTIGSDGNLYGTTFSGGTSGGGTVFNVTPAGVLTTLQSCSIATGEGFYWGTRLAVGSDGNFYGTTEGGGGAYDYGTVFKMTPKGVWTVLYLFTGGADGASPGAGLLLGRDGNFYGTTTRFGGSGLGTFFKITPSGALTTLYSFSGSDGFQPYGALVQGSDGAFYGTANGGGANAFGSIFKITSAGALTTLYSFSARNAQGNNTDGAYPDAGLTVGSDGNFYGTANSGGAFGNGTVFKITPAGVFTALYSFGVGTNDGASPSGALVQGSDGNLYGTTTGGGANVFGALFRITTSGVLTTLHSFTGADGELPYAGLVMGSDGNFYGTASAGGANGSGTIFKLTMAPSAGSMYALWNHSGQASLWKIPVSGSMTTASFGPYTGWTPAGLTSDTSGNAYMLWTSTTGQASVWKLSSSLALTTSQTFGPFTGWSAKSIAVGPDGNVHLLWNGPSNAASIYNVVLGTSITSKGYGPFTGWQATQIAVDSNNNTRVLWTDAAASQASLWNITSAGVQTSQSFGPYSGWQAQSLAMGSDNLARMLWAQTSTKQASIFTVSPSGSVTSKALGPYTGWSPTGLAVNKDGDSDLMWTSTSNALSMFDIGSTGSFTSNSYGPYSGWAPVAIAAGP